MGSLRDELLKAGLVDRKSKQRAETEVRRKKKKRKKKQADQEEAARRAAYEEEVARKAAENRAREAARKAEQEKKERDNRVANLVRAWSERSTGRARQRWYFVARGRTIWFLEVTAEQAWKLEMGTLAIVRNPMDPDEPFALVPRSAAEKIEAIDPEVVRFWNREGKPRQVAEEDNEGKH